MSSLEDFMVGARHQLKLTGPNRAVCGLVVALLDEIVRSLNQDASLKEEIESLKVNRRILSQRVNTPSIAPKSRKLAAIQRLSSDAHEFLVDYLHGNKRMSRNTAKQAYRNFHTAITDVRKTGLIVSLSEQEFDSAWETDTLRRFMLDPELCLVFWIDEEHVDQKTLEFFESEMVMIVPCLSKQLKERLAILQPLANTCPTAGATGFVLNTANTYQGRFRIVVNPRDAQQLLTVLQKAGLLTYPMLLLTSNMALSGLNPAVEIQSIKLMKPDILLSSRDFDVRNFCQMGAVVWLNPPVDSQTPGTPPLERVEEARRHILAGSARHGTFVFELKSSAAFLEFIDAMKLWLRQTPGLRILMSHHNFRTLTGKEPLPDYSSASITELLLSLRTKLGFPKTPVLVFSSELSALHDSVYSLPICKPTSSIEEAIDVSAMWPLAWAPDWSLFDALVKEKTWTGELRIFDISCFNLTGPGTLEPYVIVNVVGQKKAKFKSKKQERITEPSWASLNWTLPISASDVIRFKVMDHDKFTKDTCLGEACISVREFFKSPMPLMETTLVLHTGKEQSRTGGTVTIKLGLSVSTRSGETSQQEVEDLGNSEAIIEAGKSFKMLGAHFGRPLGDSLHRCEERGMRHVAHACILYIFHEGLNSVGVFRVVGNRKKVREAQMAFDAERDPVIDDPFVAASLLKLYLRELPDPLISSSIYKQFLALQHVTSYKQLLPEMRQILGQLSRTHRDLLADILELLHTVAENEATNMMSSRNLATTIAPTLCISKSMNTLIDINELLLDTNAVIDLVQIAIHYNRYLFPETEEDEALPAEIQAMDGSTKQLDRSPPSSPENSDDEA